MTKPLDVDIIGVRDNLPILNEMQARNFDSTYINVCNTTFLNRGAPMFRFETENKDKKAVIFHNPDQHFPEEIIPIFRSAIQDYKYKIMIVDEPIWNKHRAGPVSEHNHTIVLNELQPDLVGYSCPYDCLASPANTFYWSNMVDIYAHSHKPKQNWIVASGKKHTHRQTQQTKIVDTRLPKDQVITARAVSWSLLGNLCNWSGVRPIVKLTEANDLMPLEDVEQISFDRPEARKVLPYSKIASMVAQSKFHYQPMCGYSIHNLRSLLALFCGSIPVIHAHDFGCPQLKMHMDLLNLEDGKNCLLFNDSPMAMVNVGDIMRDASAADEILRNIEKMDLQAYSSTAMSKIIWEIQK